LSDKEEIPKQTPKNILESQNKTLSLKKTNTAHFNEINNSECNNDNLEKENENIDKIKNQIIRNITILDSQQKEEQKNNIITNSPINKESKENIDIIKNYDIKNNFIQRKNTHKSIGSFKLRNSILNGSANGINNYQENNEYINIGNNNNANQGFNRNVTYKKSNSNNNSMTGIDEALSMKSFKLVRQTTNTQSLLKPEKHYLKQNSHLSFKSNSSNKNSILTFQNHILYKDRESVEFGNSILEVNIYK